MYHFFVFSGDVKTYESVDRGEVQYMSTRSPKVLHLKVNAPVMLAVNLSDQLVNGLMGHVKLLSDDSVCVSFEVIDQEVEIHPYTFSHYNTATETEDASRIQIPLRLAFSSTVHRAQGLTIERLHVHCQHMNQYGQLNVALSRSVLKKNIRVTAFNN